MEEETNHGLIYDPRSTHEKADDYVMGGDASIEMPKRTTVWLPYLSVGVPQSLSGKFDSMSCVSYAVIQAIETQMNYDYPSYPQELKDWLIIKGYIKDDKIVFSKRFLAIISGTTNQGNYYQKVFEAARTVGLIPDIDLPFGGTSFDEYIGATLTPEMYAKSLEFTKRVKISYQLLNGWDGAFGLSPVEMTSAQVALETVPLVVGIAGHAIISHAIRPNDYDVLDHYVPYLRTNDAITKPIFIEYVCTALPVKAPLKPKISLSRDLKMGDKGDDVVQLQDMLKYEGFFDNSVVSSGFFGIITKKAVIKFQEKYAEEILRPLGLVYSVGYVGASTRKWVATHY